MIRCVANISRPACAIAKPHLQVLTKIPLRYIRTHDPSPPKQSASSPSSTQDAPQPSPGEPPPPKLPSLEHLLAEINPADNPLLTPVHLPENAKAVLKSDHPATNILTQPGLVVQRQHEMMDVFLGFEQADRYVILDPHGNHIGYMAEHDGVSGKISPRQWFKTNRAITTHIFNRHSQEALRFHRPFSRTNARIRVCDAIEPNLRFPGANGNSGPQPRVSGLSHEAMPIIGEVHLQWAPMRRKYNLFISSNPDSSQPGTDPIFTKPMENSSELQNQQIRQTDNTRSFAQFAYIDEPSSSWDFSLTAEDGRLIASVNRSFRGIDQDIFTSTGSYVLHMDAARLEQQAQKEQPISQPSRTNQSDAEVLVEKDNKHGITLDQRAVLLATAVAVNFDCFSNHSAGDGVGFIPLWIPGGGGSTGAGGGASGAGEVGAVVGGAGRAVGGAAGGIGASEGAIAGAGSLAGYEAMRRGMEQGPSPTTEDANPQAQPPDTQSPQGGGDSQDQQGDVWGQGDSDPWSDAGASGGEGGGGWLQWLWDLFD